MRAKPHFQHLQDEGKIARITTGMEKIPRIKKNNPQDMEKLKRFIKWVLPGDVSPNTRKVMLVKGL